MCVCTNAYMVTIRKGWKTVVFREILNEQKYSTVLPKPSAHEKKWRWVLTRGSA